MSDAVTQEYRSNGIGLLRETFDGGLPGEGTAYLDHNSGIRATLSAITAEQASRRLGDRPSIAAHARHMNFHMRVTIEWVQGDHSKRDWPGSFEPQTVTEEEWAALRQELDATRRDLVQLLESLSPEALAGEGAGMGAVAHLAYHLGAIRQLMHLVR
jgi:hypothetical protein